MQGRAAVAGFDPWSIDIADPYQFWPMWHKYVPIWECRRAELERKKMGHKMTNAPELVERVARAIWEAKTASYKPFSFEEVWRRPGLREILEEQAQSAIEAMRGP